MIRNPIERFEILKNGRKQRAGKMGWEVARWLFSVRLGQRNRQRYPDCYRMVKYEALICQPEETLREICAFIGEEFFPGMLTMQGAMRFGEEQPGGRSDELSAEQEQSAWPGRISNQEIAFLQAWARKEMRALGYSEDPAQLSSQDILKLCTVNGAANVIGALLWNAIKTN
jgi:hypothetical protein